MHRTEQGMVLTRAWGDGKGRSIYMSLARVLGNPSSPLLSMSWGLSRKRTRMASFGSMRNSLFCYILLDYRAEKTAEWCAAVWCRLSQDRLFLSAPCL